MAETEESGAHETADTSESKHLAAAATLTAVEARVLGALMEKAATTPEYYPLSLNALLNACNQKSSREPVMQLAEDDVRQALHTLDRKGLAGAVRGGDSRVAKYEHRTAEKFNFRRDEAALLCLLLLRGPQTPGELRNRSDRLHPFEEIEAVLAGLQRLGSREPTLVRQLPRQSGMKEARWAQLLTGEPEVAAVIEQGSPAKSALEERVTRLEEEVARLGEILRRHMGEKTVHRLKGSFPD